MAALEQTCARPPTSLAVWLHQIHAAGGVAAPPPWWWWLLCVCDVCFGLVWLLSLILCDNYQKIILRWGEALQSGPPRPVPRLAPYHLGAVHGVGEHCAPPHTAFHRELCDMHNMG